jgi:hypothetical protein
VDLDVAAGWQSGALGWTETQRIEARTRRLEEDVRRLLGARPESLAIGFIHLPIGGYFQTGDGPAVRVALDDPTARSWMIRDIPDRILNDPRAPLALLDYDSYVAHRLIGLRPDDPGVIRAACEQLLRGKGRSALVLARYAGRADSSDILPAYLAMASSLAEGGTRADFARIAPSVRGRPVRGALAVGEPHTARALSIAVADPIVPDVHRQAADSLHAHGAPMLEAVELWIAVQLDPTRAADALRLGRLIAGPMPDAARRAFVIASAPGAPPEVLAQARAATSALPPDRETP